MTWQHFCDTILVTMYICYMRLVAKHTASMHSQCALKYIACTYGCLDSLSPEQNKYSLHICACICHTIPQLATAAHAQTHGKCVSLSKALPAPQPITTCSRQLRLALSR
jgi:hypothetical protein